MNTFFFLILLIGYIGSYRFYNLEFSSPFLPLDIYFCILMSRLGRVVTKTGIVGATIYGTKELGIWGDDTEKVYRTLYTFITPFIDDIPVEIPELPKITNITSAVKNSWNNGVLTAGQFMLRLPENASSWTNNAVNFISNQFINPSSENP